MFTQEWRQYWGLVSDPFACEDADKDYVLAEIDAAAVHSGFDRIYGDPRLPAPGIVFGEKGSGKSGLRLMMSRRLAEHNAENPDARVFAIEYIDFNPFLERFRGGSSKSASAILERWTVADHLDSLLSLATSRLVDGALAKEERAKLTKKQRTGLLVLTSLYYESKDRTAAEAVAGLRSVLHAYDGRKLGRWFVLLLLTLASVALAILPHVLEADLGAATTWYAGGAALLAVTWIANLVLGWRISRRAKRAATSVRVLARDAEPLGSVITSLSPSQRDEYPLPDGSREEARYELLQRLMNVTEAFGYHGWYVLMDRIDEPSLLSGDGALMGAFVEKLLDIKLLQYSGLALKLFLPIELESIYRTASAEDLKSMRLDKSNLIPELKWGGQELLEIANKRLAACVEEGSRATSVVDFFEDDFDLDYLRGTLHVLGTPRYCFGFLSAVVLDHVKDLPSDLAADSSEWKITRARFDIERAAWIDRTGLLRRTMN